MSREMQQYCIDCDLMVVLIVYHLKLGEYEGIVGSLVFRLFPCFFLVLDPRRRLGGLGEKVWSACKEFQESEGGIWLAV